MARLLGPLAVRSGIDDGIATGDEWLITRSALVFLGLLGVQYATQRYAQYGVALVAERYLRMLRSTVFRHLMRLDMGFYGRSKAGVLVSRMTNDIESIQEFAEEGAVSFAINLLTILGVAVGMMLVDGALALEVFTVIGGLVIVSWVFQRFAGRAYRERLVHAQR